VRNLEKLQNSRGEPLPTRRTIALCRCGGSANKPFCDGTHSTIGFSGERLADGSKDKRISYRGKKITIHDNRGICSHAGFCTDNLGSVFHSEREPWISPDGATVEKIIEVIKQCPSGALSYSIEEVEHRGQAREPMVTVSKDGPYYVTGEIELKDHPRGEGASEEHCTLCRCGASKNKPFCDGSHWEISFTDEKN
jgi:CDGSH-type Zn-finger protein